MSIRQVERVYKPYPEIKRLQFALDDPPAVEPAAASAVVFFGGGLL
jgi:hypothetical protein